jgi:hypothetical protein
LGKAAFFKGTDMNTDHTAWVLKCCRRLGSPPATDPGDLHANRLQVDSRAEEIMNTIIDQTDELLRMGAAEYPDIAGAERDLLYGDLAALQDAARSAFARPLGFVSGKPFTLDELHAGEATGLAEEDPSCAFMGKGRVDFFYRDDKPIAIVGHSRARWSDCYQFGMTHGLEAAALPGSWRSPGTCIAVLYTRPGFVHLPKPRVQP